MNGDQIRAEYCREEKLVFSSRCGLRKLHTVISFMDGGQEIVCKCGDDIRATLLCPDTACRGEGIAKDPNNPLSFDRVCTKCGRTYSIRGDK